MTQRAQKILFTASAVFILLSAVTARFYIETRNVTRIDKASIVSDTKNTIQNGEYRRKIVDSKETLKAEIANNPQLIKEILASKDESLSGLRTAIKKDTKKGKIINLLTDGIENTKITRLITEKNNFDLYFLSGTGLPEPGSTATIDGYSYENILVAETVSQVEQSVRPAATQYDVLFVRFNWANDTSQPFTDAQIAAQAFSNVDSVNNYFQEVSYNNVTLNGTTANVSTNWYTLAGHNKGTGCTLTAGGDVDQWTTDADALAGVDYNYANYDRVAYIFPTNPSCGWSGLGQAPGDRTWYNGTVDHFVVAHELGHNFGAGHSDTIDCGTKTIDTYSSCITTEYGDPYDVMGNSGYYHMNVAWKNLVGWLPDSRVLTVTSSGTYSIDDLETSSSGYQAIKISKPDTTDTYWFEFRQPSGFDSSLSTAVTNGIIGHIYSNKFESYYDTYLLDFTPANNFTDIALTDGISFEDLSNKVTVKQNSHTSSAVSITVTFTNTAPITPTYMPVYRFWNANGTHFYTASESEKNNVIARWPNIYTFEGVAYQVNTSSGQNSAPLYRVWNTNGTHFYTANWAEVTNATSRWPNQYQFEGVAYYVSLSPSGTIPVYRFWNANGTHFYTASESEKNNVIARWPNIYSFEGVGFYIGS